MIQTLEGYLSFLVLVIPQEPQTLNEQVLLLQRKSLLCLYTELFPAQDRVPRV